MSSTLLHTPKRLGSYAGYRLWTFLFVLAIGMQHATARHPPAPRQQLQTPYSDGVGSDESSSDDNSDEIEQRRANLKAVLANQLQRASGRLSSSKATNAIQRRPALVAPQPAVRLSKPRYVGYEQQTSSRLTANSNESDSNSDSISNENENDVTAMTESDEDADVDVDAGDETDSLQNSQRATTDDDDDDDNENGDERENEEEGTYDPYNDNFYDLNTDGSYVYGYSLPNGVRRYERAVKSTHGGLIVEGFFAQPRQLAHSLLYELRCYRSDAHGYHPLAVEYLKKPPHVQRDEEPDVDCLHR